MLHSFILSTDLHLCGAVFFKHTNDVFHDRSFITFPKKFCVGELVMIHEWGFYSCFSGAWFWFVGGFCMSQCWLFSHVFLFAWFWVFSLLVGLEVFWCLFGFFFFFICFMELGVVVGWVWGIFCLVAFRDSGKCQ